jgi:hypothetical protein
MACSSCGGGRTSAPSHMTARGVAESWRLTHSDGAEVFYTDGDRAKNDHGQIPGSRLDKIDPFTGAVLSS